LPSLQLPLNLGHVCEYVGTIVGLFGWISCRLDSVPADYANSFHCWLCEGEACRWSNLHLHLHVGTLLEVLACTGALNDLADRLLQFIPIIGCDLRHLGTEVLLNLHQHLPITPTADERHSHTDTSETSSSADTVEVRLGISSKFAATDEAIRNIVVDDHGDRLYIDTTGQDVGRDENFGMAETEGIDDDITLSTFITTSERDDLVTLNCHTLFDSGCCLSSLILGQSALNKVGFTLTLTKIMEDPIVSKP